MSSYTNNTTGTSLAVIGQIVAYVGTTDPEGWLICDGRAFSGITGYPTGAFDTLKTLLGSATNLPDLKGKNLYGSSSFGSTGGSQNVTLTYNNLPDHSHSGTTNSPGNHLHSWADNYYQDSRNTGPNSNDGDDGGRNIQTGRTTAAATYSGDHTVNSPTFYGVVTPTAINITNPHYTVNWIIKY